MKTRIDTLNSANSMILSYMLYGNVITMCTCSYHTAWPCVACREVDDLVVLRPQHSLLLIAVLMEDDSINSIKTRSFPGQICIILIKTQNRNCRNTSFEHIARQSVLHITAGFLLAGQIILTGSNIKLSAGTGSESLPISAWSERALHALFIEYENNFNAAFVHCTIF